MDAYGAAYRHNVGMSIPDYSGNPAHRLSTAERDRAVTELRQHVAEGRLTETEFAERSKAARNAVTRGDLAPLFDDLPATTFPSTVGDASADKAPATDAPATDAPADGVPDYGAPEIVHATPRASSPAVHAAPGATEGGKEPQATKTGRVGETVMAIVPFASLALFFVTSSAFGWSYSWLWFTLIPVAGIIIYGPNGRRRR